MYHRKPYKTDINQNCEKKEKKTFLQHMQEYRVNTKKN